MNRKDDFSPPLIGICSLLVILSVLIITVFSMLSLSTVLADRRISSASLKAVSAYYEADSKAEEIFARLRNGEIPEDVTVRDNLYTYECPISDNQKLVVELVSDEEKWTVKKWQAVSTAEYEQTILELWDGEAD